MNALVPGPRHRGGHVLYLDYDGVLHPERVHQHPKKGPYIKDPNGHTLFEHALLLEYLLRPYPDVRIVLSTSWAAAVPMRDRFRLNQTGGYSVAKAAKKLTPGLRARVVGGTFHSEMDYESFKAAPRGMQVWSDVTRRQPKAWLALDDDYLHWPAWCRDNLVRTDEENGIAEPSVRAELVAKLEKQFSDPI